MSFLSFAKGVGSICSGVLLRALSLSQRSVTPWQQGRASSVFTQSPRCLSQLLAQPNYSPALLSAPPTCLQPVRTRVTCSRTTGKSRTVSAVVQRFFRLHNGQWIRTRAGRHKHLWRKSLRRRLTATQHVMCNRTQCTLLDKMVNTYFKKPKYYVNDPYEHYHKMTNLPDHRFVKRKFYP